MGKFAQYETNFFKKVTRLSKAYHANFIKEITTCRHISKLDEINTNGGGVVILFPSLDFK